METEYTKLTFYKFTYLQHLKIKCNDLLMSKIMSIVIWYDQFQIFWLAAPTITDLVKLNVDVVWQLWMLHVGSLGGF
jgi:hypothetical protein